MIEQNSNSSEVFILDQNHSDFLKELAAYNGLDNLGEELSTDIDDKMKKDGISIEDFWFLGV